MIDRSDDEGRFLAYSSLISIVEDNVPSIERVNGRETLDFVVQRKISEDFVDQSLEVVLRQIVGHLCHPIGVLRR